MINAVI